MRGFLFSDCDGFGCGSYVTEFLSAHAVHIVKLRVELLMKLTIKSYGMSLAMMDHTHQPSNTSEQGLP